MRLMAEGGSERRFWAACVLPIVAFTMAATERGVSIPVFLLLATVLVVFLAPASGSGASWATVDSQEIVAHFTFRSSESIPLARIAAVAVRRRLMWTRSVVPESATFISVFRKDVPSVIEIRARTSEADAFLFALARNAKRLGASQLATFAVPRRHYVHDLLPLVPAIAIVFLFPFPASSAALALAVAVFVIHSALGWCRFAKYAHTIANGKVPAEAHAWVELLRIA